MAKNIKSNNSKLTKFFLLSYANAAILTATPQNVMAIDTVITDIITKKEVFKSLDSKEQFVKIQNLVVDENFKKVSNQDRQKLKEIVTNDYTSDNTGIKPIDLVK